MATANATKISVIITGATGMVGEGVLFECLEHPAVERVLLVNRKPYPGTHPKLRECIVPDFFTSNPLPINSAVTTPAFSARASARRE
jgi:hypothetical protein